MKRNIKFRQLNYGIVIFALIFCWSCKSSSEKTQSAPKLTNASVQNTSSSTEKLYFNQFTSKNGLPSTQVWNVYQDRFGYIWAATNEGVARFDGYHFYPYYDDTKRNVHLKMASRFFEDSDGTLWLLSGSGYLNRFDRNSDKFIHIKTPFENGWSEQSTHTIIEDSLKNFWIGAYGGLQYFDRKKDTFITYPISRIRDTTWLHEEKLRFGAMHLDKRGNIWIGTRKFGFVKFNIASKTYHTYRFDKEYYYKILSDWITDIVPLPDGTLLLSEWDVGIIHWNPVTEKIIKIIKINEVLQQNQVINIRDMFLEDKNTLWLGTDNDGLIVFDLSQNKVIAQYKKNSIAQKGISGNTVRHISKDRQGTFWVSSGTLENASPKFYHFADFFASATPNSLRNDNIYSLANAPKNKLLVSTANGLSLYDDSTQTFDNSIDFGTKNLQTYGVLAAQDGTYWLSFKDKIVHFESNTQKIIKEYDAKLPVDSSKANFLKRACRMMQDSRGVVWTINHWGRLNKIDEKTDEVIQITELSQDETKQKFVNSLGMIDDPNHQRIIVCSDYGLATVDYFTNKILHKKLIVNGLDLSKENISYIYKSKSGGNAWLIIAGKPYSLNLENFELVESKLAKKYNVDSFKWIVESPKGTLWLSCFRGIVKYDIAQKNSSIYYSQNVADYTFDSPSPVTELNNKIFFGGFKGLTIIEPAKVKENSIEPQILIESATFTTNKMRRKTDTTQLLYDLKNLELDYYQNKITLKYAGLHFDNADQTKYTYKLDGYDTDWIEANDEQEAIYTNLSPKKYVFRVKSANCNGEWNKESAKLNIEIHPPIWQTWIAYLFYLAAISAIIYYFIRFRVQSRLQKIKDLEAVRVRISSNLHDDVGTILSGLAMQSQMMALTTKGKEKESLLQLSDMSHDAMERMRDTVWAIDSRKDKYENLIDRMRAFAEKNLNMKHIKHTFKVEVEDSKKFIDPEKRQNIYLIFKEAITNICKHSDAKNVNIVFKQEKNTLYLLIHDDGSKKEIINDDGLGLSNMQMRAKNLGAILNVFYDDGFMVELAINSIFQTK
ncbi:hypothetical protein GCM10011514_53040 [Emticicia aquatilis]|uniref:Histidine kinase domain-containing protein n=1 Tax=Emticicia aquatilis TaxID=1537369 RepID=A0A916Z941_9BACT|nr:sensor histidine kinase [Emticicia aquatilis]GGD82382.1 hypothetical protein GCM10011514_53040 [Emticicia aquatilis]